MERSSNKSQLMSDRRRIDEYWEHPDTISLLDKNLRKLETDFALSQISAKDEMADFGCGDGESTVHYAARARSCLALEHSNHLRAKAAKRFAKAGLTNVTLMAGDALDLSAYASKFDLVVSQRLVINFMTWEEQKEVLQNIRNTLRKGGRYIMIENTFEGSEALNAVRRAVGLANVPLHDWHNYFLHYDRLMDFLEGKFTVEKTHTFNLYYLLTRVFVNMFAKFEGYGRAAIKDDIFDAADDAARRLYELMGDRVRMAVDKGESFGPIQGFVLRRIG
jgi:cyclopropane fatty-acyl-phospholipid synthase-like methyltransferase